MNLADLHTKNKNKKTLLCPVLSTFWVTLKIVNYVQRTIEIAQSIVMYRQKCLRIYFHINHYVVYLPIEIFMAKRKIFTLGRRNVKKESLFAKNSILAY